LRSSTISTDAQPAHDAQLDRRRLLADQFADGASNVALWVQQGVPYLRRVTKVALLPAREGACDLLFPLRGTSVDATRILLPTVNGSVSAALRLEPTGPHCDPQAAVTSQMLAQIAMSIQLG
jgi:hypothetical protein